MEDFREQYEANGLAAVLNDVKIRCTSHLWYTEVPAEKHTQIMYENLFLYITKLGILYQHEPVVLILVNACTAIKNLPTLPFSQLLAAYKKLIDHHLGKIQGIVRNKEEYHVARVLLVLFAHTVYECNNPADMLSILAEESTRGLSNEPSLLHVYHHTWASLITA